MLHSRNILMVVLICAVFVGLAAMLRVSSLPYGQLSAAASEASGVDESGEDGRLVAIDRRFFSTLTNDMVGRTSRSLPREEESMEQGGDPRPKTVPADVIIAEAYLVGDIRTGQIYLEKNAATVLPFASMSKLITAIAITDAYGLDDLVEISTTSTQVAPDASMLQAGERFTIGELLEPLLMSSSNVAAEALASAKGDRTTFLESMSGYAWEIGMPNSFFSDPTGISPRNAGTARGFFELARYLHDKRPDILAITRKSESSIATTTDHGAHKFSSTHPFVTDPRFRGGKTGRTPEALETMLTIMEISGHPIAIIVLRSDWARAEDTTLLIDKTAKILTSGQ